MKDGEIEENDSMEIITNKPKTKGKDKETTNNEEESDEDDFVFEELKMKRIEPTGLSASGKPINLLTSFQHEIKLYFEDHMGPYRGIMAEKKEPEQESGPAEITRMFKENTSRKILVATSGK